MLHVPFPRRLIDLLVVSFAIMLIVVAPAWAARPKSYSATRTVCIDAGHGGTDPGAAYAGLQEKYVTLDIATRLKALLEAQQFTVVMTRSGDTSLSNTERATICNAANADTVISIHLNAASDPTANYFKALYGDEAKDGAFTRTLWNSYALDIPKSSPTQFSSGLLLKANAPAILVETVFLSNPDEQRLLANGTGQRQQAIAQNFYDGLAAWYTSGNPGWITFQSGHSRLYFDQNGERINLEVCASNMPGNTVYVQLNRNGRVWNPVSQRASEGCVTFYDLDGAGPTFTNTNYYTRASMGAAPDPAWPAPTCYSASSGYGLCDRASR